MGKEGLKVRQSLSPPPFYPYKNSLLQEESDWQDSSNQFMAAVVCCAI